MHVRHVQIFSPVDDVLRAKEIENVVRVFLAEVEHLRGITTARTDVAVFAGDRTKMMEEEVVEMFEQPERTTTSIVQDRARTTLALDGAQLLRCDVQRFTERN